MNIYYFQCPLKLAQLTQFDLDLNRETSTSL